MSSPALTTLRLLVGVALVITVLVALAAVPMIVADEWDHTDDWDGLGTFFGLLALAAAVPAAALLSLTRVLLRRRVRAGLVLTGVCGVSLMVTGVVVGTHLQEWWSALPVGAVLTALTAIAWTRTARVPPPSPASDVAPRART
ncbi:hypothetical protein [Janibacter sp. GS2]|uniref:hypothetical protein n=1 Tax=Janibacter sp. GS2 TaxID=3442646 RepID=UPI003EB7FFC2